jgi:hypothetical protein
MVLSRDSSLSTHARLVFVVVCKYWNKDKHEAWPSVATIAACAGMSRQSVMRALRELEDSGWLDCLRTNGRVTHYRLPVIDPTGSCAGPVGVWDRSHSGTPPVAVGHRTSPTSAPEVVEELVYEPPEATSGGAGASTGGNGDFCKEVDHAAPRDAPPPPTKEGKRPGWSLDNTGAPLVTNPGPSEGADQGVVAWVPLRTRGLRVGVTRQRLDELAKGYPTLGPTGVMREFTRPGGILEWNSEAASADRKVPGRRGFWRHVQGWLEREEKGAARGRRAVLRPASWVPGTVCGCGKGKADGAQLCEDCARAYAAHVADHFSQPHKHLLRSVEGGTRSDPTETKQ